MDIGEHVVALALLVPLGGGRVEDAPPPTARAIRDMTPAASTVEAAGRELRRLGFDVRPAGPIALSIGGSRGLFERTFDTRIETVTEAAQGRRTWFRAVTPPVVPDALAHLVDRVILPTPAELFQ